MTGQTAVASADRGRVGRFVVVGCAAAAVHWSVVRGVVDGWAVAPLLANVLGWLVAFGVSFAGHHRWTFGDAPGRDVRRSLPRFLLVSLAGFVVNEATYAVLLGGLGGWRYDIVLAVVLVAVAGLTFVASRLWAFRGRH
jgi:putative flippase GtrA